jgi:ATP-dependent 26S proteasome regulatory subunit
VDKTDNLSGAHVKDLVKTAAMHAIRAKSVNETKKAVVGMEHFKAALDEVMNIDWATYYKAQNKSKKMGFSSDEY